MPELLRVKEEEQSFEKTTYIECLVKGVDPLNGEYIDLKIEKITKYI